MLNKLVLALSLAIAMVAHATPAPAPTDPTPAANVDLKQYLGTWYSIASIPINPAVNCASGMMANYTDANGLIGVINSCQMVDGTTMTVEGRARPEDPSVTSRLQVTFLRENEVWNFDNAAAYWILEVAPDYSWALVGGPKFKNAWILSRTPSLDMTVLKDLNTKLALQGYDTCKLMIDPQVGGLQDVKPLCEVVK